MSNRKKKQKRPAQGTAGSQPKGAKQAIAPAPARPIPSVKAVQTTMGKDDSDRQDSPTKTMQRIEYLQAWFNALLVIAAFLGVAVAHCQWSAMLDQVDQMRLDKRAWLYFTANIEEVAPDHVACDFQLTNHGGSPGVIKEMNLGSVLEDFPLDFKKALRDFDAAGKPETRDDPMPPGITKVIHQPILKLPDKSIEDIRGKKAVYAVFATVKYEDLTGQLRNTRCCWLYDTATKNLSEYTLGNHMD